MVVTDDIHDEIQKGVTTGFVNELIHSNPDYRPKLLINSKEKGQKVLTSLLKELENCDEFYFSVAFVTTNGVAVLINTLKELESKNVKGHILVSQYQNFTQPRALKRLIHLKNLDVRIMVEGNLHTKCYIFRKGGSYSLIVGSSNLTSAALTENTEWNLRVSSTDTGLIVTDTFHEFEKIFESAVVVDNAWIAEYEKIYNATERAYTETKECFVPTISPNKMQLRALDGLSRIRQDGKNKALLISATGTGKTYLSAFDVKKVNPEKFLFVIHRERIAQDALNSYRKIFGGSKRMGIFSGTEKVQDADFIFATVLTLEKYKEQFPKDYFEYIVIDEVHHAGAKTYQSIMDYFTPKFLLGMTATPERTDGYDIFKAFNYNIAYEIRLNDALEEHMLSPFHYYGVTDLLVNGEIVDDKTEFNKLTSEERVRRIIEYAEFYGCDRGRVKGLIFCSRVQEAEKLSELLNKHHLRTIAITGDSNDSQRKQAIDRLESDGDDALDYILTVDIFNEGIDIPSVNQIIMLRPTQSAIIFVQQLGRGLRLSPGKDYLTVIDFIGNYENNYLVPIALFGDRSYNKDTLRKLVSSGSALIPGSSSVNFDEVSKQKIYSAINSAKVNSVKQLMEDYTLLKFKIGRIPTMMDFVVHGSRDPYQYVEKDGSLYSFIAKVEDELPNRLSEEEAKLLNFLSDEICNGIRIEEPIILETLIHQNSVTVDELLSKVNDCLASKSDNIAIHSKMESIESSIRGINGLFYRGIYKKNKYSIPESLLVNDGVITRSNDFESVLSSETFVFYLSDAIKYAIDKFKKSINGETYKDGLILYNKYSRKDVCRVLNWSTNDESSIYGYRIKHNTCPIFVTYEKSDNISESTKYPDYFISNQKFHWMTRSRVKLDSIEPMQIRAYKETGLRICLFVKKSDDEGSDFYYMGDMTPCEDGFHQTQQPSKDGILLPIVNINYDLEVPVDDNLYKYLHEMVSTKKSDDSVEVPITEEKFYTRSDL